MPVSLRYHSAGWEGSEKALGMYFGHAKVRVEMVLVLFGTPFIKGTSPLIGLFPSVPLGGGALLSSP